MQNLSSALFWRLVANVRVQHLEQGENKKWMFERKHEIERIERLSTHSGSSVFGYYLLQKARRNPRGAGLDAETNFKIDTVGQSFI